MVLFSQLYGVWLDVYENREGIIYKTGRWAVRVGACLFGGMEWRKSVLWLGMTIYHEGLGLTRRLSLLGGVAAG